MPDRGNATDLVKTGYTWLQYIDPTNITLAFRAVGMGARCLGIETEDLASLGIRKIASGTAGDRTGYFLVAPSDDPGAATRGCGPAGESKRDRTSLPTWVSAMPAVPTRAIRATPNPTPNLSSQERESVEIGTYARVSPIDDIVQERADFRFSPINTGVLGGAPRGFPGIAVAVPHERRQEVVWHPQGQIGVAADRGTEPKAAFHVMDMKADKLDRARAAPLHSLARVTQYAPGVYRLARMHDVGGADGAEGLGLVSDALGSPAATSPSAEPDSGGELATHPEPDVATAARGVGSGQPAGGRAQPGAPEERADVSSARVIAWMPSSQGGIAHPGVRGDIHRDGSTADGEPRHPMHIGTDALRIMSADRDAAAEHSATVYPRTTGGPLAIPVEMRYDPLSKHVNRGRSFDGLWRRVGLVPVGIDDPKLDDGDNPPREDPPERPPTGGPPPIDGGGGGEREKGREETGGKPQGGRGTGGASGYGRGTGKGSFQPRPRTGGEALQGPTGGSGEETPGSSAPFPHVEEGPPPVGTFTGTTGTGGVLTPGGRRWHLDPRDIKTDPSGLTLPEPPEPTDEERRQAREDEWERENTAQRKKINEEVEERRRKREARDARRAKRRDKGHPELPARISIMPSMAPRLDKPCGGSNTFDPSFDSRRHQEIHDREADPSKRETAWSPMEVAVPSLAGRPGSLEAGAKDLRFDAGVGGRSVEEHRRTAPTVGRLEWISREDATGPVYTVKPCRGHHSGGTAPGSCVLNPPERTQVEMEGRSRLDLLLALAARKLSSNGLILPPTAALGFGMARRDGTGFADGIKASHANLTGTLEFAGFDAAGAATGFEVRIDRDGEALDVEGAGGLEVSLRGATGVVRQPVFTDLTGDPADLQEGDSWPYWDTGGGGGPDVYYWSTFINGAVRRVAMT